MRKFFITVWQWQWPVILLVLAIAVIPGPRVNADEPTGEQIYRQQCASCHGVQGEGTVEHHPDPLVGDRSLKELARFINESMPEDAPEKCVGADAEKVAAYIYDAFYSEVARARRAPLRIELARLTVRQYENAVADLVGSFRAPGTWDGERGLTGEYFDSHDFRGDKRVLERRDATVNFDFGAERPQLDRPAAAEETKPGDAGSKDKDQEVLKDFSIRWRGAIMAPESGDYEILLETENGAKLWINDLETPLIDAWVQSGSQVEHRQTVRLLGGRAVPLRLDYFKHKEKSASIRLKWKPPGQAADLIPERLFSPHAVAPTLVVTTPFPPDDRSVGYVRGTTVSKQWDEATTYAALEVANYVVQKRQELAGVEDSAPDRQQRLREFCHRFAQRAFRRPLTDEEQAHFVDRAFEAATDLEKAVQKVVILVLKSPRFLYREAAGGEFPAFAVASWISFALWDSLPDQQLLDAAAAGKLAARDEIVQQAQRMTSDLRARSKLREFFHDWLLTERFHDIAKDTGLYPGFDDSLVSDLRTSLDLFLDDVAWSDASDFRQLLLADAVYVNGRIAQFYGAPLPSDAPFQKVTWEPGERAGVVSHPYLMAGFAYDSASSPIHRGVFLSRSLLGRTLKPPPDAVTPLAVDLHPELNTRERVTLQTNPAACQSCHVLINGLGFALESFDAAGKFRATERERPIDASGSYVTRSGERVEFSGVRQLAGFLATSEEVQRAFIERLFQYMIKQPIQAFGDDALQRLQSSFVENQYSIRNLLVDIAATSVQTGNTDSR
jgi:hypothetical protein